MPTTLTTDSSGPARLALLITAASIALSGCAGPGEEPEGTRAAASDTGGGGAPAEARPARTTDTIGIEGLAEPIELRLFEAGDDFALPFTTYVPQDMAAEVHDERTLDIVAEFGGTRNEDAFIHVFVFPEGTPWQEAVATAKGFKSGHGIPVSEGIEPLQDDLARPDWLGWAEEAYRYIHQGGAGSFGGTLGLGIRDGRAFMIVTQRPVEYAEGFDPRTRLILDRWRWADGSPLSSAGTPGLPGPRGPLP